MDVLIAARNDDLCVPRFVEEAEYLGCKTTAISYEDLVRVMRPIPDLNLTADLALCARMPMNKQYTVSYEGVLKVLIDEINFIQILDNEVCRTGYLKLEDKLYQTYFFESLGMPYAKIVNIDNKKQISYPIIAKRRVSGRSTGNYVLQGHTDWERWREKDMSQYIFQEFIPLKSDCRVLVLGDEVLGVVDRKVKLYEDGRVAVKVVDEGKVSSRIEKECIAIRRALGVDFLGLDVGIGVDGKHFFIEYNMYPYFISFERETGVNVASKVVEYLVKQA